MKKFTKLLSKNIPQKYYKLFSNIDEIHICVTVSYLCGFIQYIASRQVENQSEMNPQEVLKVQALF
jgi:hypothetical protein